MAKKKKVLKPIPKADGWGGTASAKRVAPKAPQRKITSEELQLLRQLKAEADAAFAQARSRAAALDEALASIYVGHGALVGVDLVCFNCGSLTTANEGCGCTPVASPQPRQIR